MLDELFEEVNSRAPGFGGMHWGRPGVLVIRITQQGAPAKVQTAVREVFAAFPWEKVWSIEFRAADFEVAELQSARVQVHAAIGRDVIWTDFDEVSNVVRAGVERTADLAVLDSRMASRGIPPGAVRFEHADRPAPAQLLGNTHNPTVGGVQILFYDSTFVGGGGGSSSGPCTLGFNVRLSTDQSHEYFVTASHCTPTIGANDGIFACQPLCTGPPTDSPTAVEVQDPAFSSGLSGCPANDVCRYSDAALFKYLAASTPNFAYLARDSSFSSTMGVNGSRFRVDSFHVVSDIPEAYLLVADTVNYDTWMHKVGITTGWTWGNLIHTCRTTGAATGKWYLCQYNVSAHAAGGDSGSPTFWWMCCGVNEAWLGGILHHNLPGYYYTFSSISGVKNDIANLVTY